MMTREEIYCYILIGVTVMLQSLPFPLVGSYKFPFPYWNRTLYHGLSLSLLFFRQKSSLEHWGVMLLFLIIDLCL